MSLKHILNDDPSPPLALGGPAAAGPPPAPPGDAASAARSPPQAYAPPAAPYTRRRTRASSRSSPPPALPPPPQQQQPPQDAHPHGYHQPLGYPPAGWDHYNGEQRAQGEAYHPVSGATYSGYAHDPHHANAQDEQGAVLETNGRKKRRTANAAAAAATTVAAAPGVVAEDDGEYVPPSGKRVSVVWPGLVWSVADECLWDSAVRGATRRVESRTNVRNSPLPRLSHQSTSKWKSTPTNRQRRNAGRHLQTSKIASKFGKTRLAVMYWRHTNGRSR